jgi:hypothetical protein
MLNTFNTSDNLALNSQREDTLNKINYLIKALKLCKQIQGNLLIKLIDKIKINSNTLSR